MKIKVTLGIDSHILAHAKKRKINLSKTLEDAILYELGDIKE